MFTTAAVMLDNHPEYAEQLMKNIKVNDTAISYALPGQNLTLMIVYPSLKSNPRKLSYGEVMKKLNAILKNEL